MLPPILRLTYKRYIMNNVVIKAARTEDGYCCACDLLPGWVVAYDGDLEGFKEYVQESVDFWLEGRRKDGDVYPAVFMVNISSSMISTWLRCSTTIVAYSRLPLFSQ